MIEINTIAAIITCTYIHLLLRKALKNNDLKAALFLFHLALLQLSCNWKNWLQIPQLKFRFRDFLLALLLLTHRLEVRVLTEHRHLF